MSQYADGNAAEHYFRNAEKMLKSLSCKYTSPKVGNGGFILDHSVGNMPAGTEIDVPLTYADYYYVEALSRYKEMVK